MTPRRIFDQVITNWPGETWLREHIEMETEDGETTARVYQGATAEALADPASTARARRVDAPDSALETLSAEEAA